MSGTAAEVHAIDVVEPVAPAVWVVDAIDRALVLGSNQAMSTIDEDAARASGLSVVRRRSGGGAVLVDSDSVVWIDVIIPRDGPHWSDDVGRSPMWLGELWARVLSQFGLDADVHQPPMPRDELAKVVCFVGRGPGEVSSNGLKVVGISQRRTRSMARFQCAALLEWDADELLSVMPALSDEDRARVSGTAAGLGVSGDSVVEAFLTELGTTGVLGL